MGFFFGKDDNFLKAQAGFELMIHSESSNQLRYAIREQFEDLKEICLKILFRRTSKNEGVP